MTIDTIIKFCKRKGFRDTLEILMNVKDNSLERSVFYQTLNTFSYYNSFFRVRDDMINNDLLTITQRNGKNIIALTEKGVEMYNKLAEIQEIINS